MCLGLEGACQFYQELVDKIGDAIGVADGEPIWNGYLGQWQVAVDFEDGCKSVVCDIYVSRSNSIKITINPKKASFVILYIVNKTFFN